MANQSNHSCPGSCPLSRRSFLGKTALTAGGLYALSAHAPSLAALPAAKLRIRVIYALHAEKQAQPDWPNIGYDFAPAMERINAAITQNFPHLELLPTMATGEEQAKKILADDQSQAIDGYLVYQMNCWNRVVQTMATSGKPVLYADFQFGGSGGFLVYSAKFLREQTPNVGFIASSRIEDLLAAMECFQEARRNGSSGTFASLVSRVRAKNTAKRGDLACLADPLTTLPTDECVRLIRQSKILAFRGTESGPAPDMMTIPVEYISFSELNDAWMIADKDEACGIADLWQTSAMLIEGVSRETLEQSAAMYLAQKAVLQHHGGNAITINCLGGFYGGHIHAYPCLGFHQLQNEGLVGACECDIPSTATMVAMTTLTQGRPGYISDPVIDTAKRQIIYAHCVASNKVFGPQGAANPFQILTHSEDRQGASVRSILPLDYMTTTMEISKDRKEILMHQAKAVANDPDDRACRTKLAAEPIGDLEKLFTAWDQWGWHRVTYFGDLKKPVYDLADALGWKVIEEA